MNYADSQYLKRKGSRKRIDRIYLYLEIHSQWHTGELVTWYKDAEKFFAEKMGWL